MGNKLGRRRQLVDDKYTRPQGLYQHKDVDHKKLRKLILDSKLAPCYPGDDDSGCDLEECPICFLYYPSLNRSRCCMKGICTECFLQMKTPNSTRPTQCPFCKTVNYAVEYRGVKTKEEKGMEQIEEQRVIEAKIRMRQEEVQDEEERIQKRQEMSSSSRIIEPTEVENISGAGEEIISVQQPGAATFRRPSLSRQNREEEFDLDLENIMLMEAIWLSFQEEGKQQQLCNPNHGGAARLMKPAIRVHALASMASSAESASSLSSPSGGLACAIAALAERQQMGADGTNNNSSHSGNTSTYNGVDVHGPTETSEAEACYDDSGGGRATGPYGDGGHTGGPSLVPESFEEQMMLAMAVSLAEARARTSVPEFVWH